MAMFAMSTALVTLTLRTQWDDGTDPQLGDGLSGSEPTRWSKALGSEQL
jgi:hypothetical protein